MISINTSNDELIELAKHNNEEAFNMLLFKCNGIISMICINYIKRGKKYGITFQELKSVAEYAIFNSLKYFDKTKSNFKTFLNLIINQELAKYVKKIETRFYELSSYLSFEDNVYENSSLEWDEVIGDPGSSIVDWYNTNEKFDYFDGIEEAILSKKDKNIMYLRASGYTYSEAAKKLNTSKSHADFTIKKIKKIVLK